MDLRISSTGVRDGELIEAIPSKDKNGKLKETQNKGSVFKIKGYYPPCKKYVNELLEDTEKVKFYLNNFPFFAKMTYDQRVSWLKENAQDPEKPYICDFDIKLKIISLGGSAIKKSFTEDQISTLIGGNPNDPEGYWDATEFHNFFPRKPGSKAFRHSMFLRPSNWRLKPVPPQKDFNGVIIDPITLEMKQGIATLKDTSDQLMKLKAEGDLEVGIYYKHSVTPPNFVKLWEHFKLDKGIMDYVKSLISWFPPSLHKSLIQKLIRTCATHVTLPPPNGFPLSSNEKEKDEEFTVPAREVLAASFELLYIKKKTFSPTKGRSVSGQESASKRLAVSITEDSRCTNYKAICTMFCCAYVAQNGETWHPPHEVFIEWMTAGFEALEDKRMYKYETRPSDLSIKDWSPYSIAYMIINSIGSFTTDVGMMSDIATNKGELEPFNEESEWLKQVKRTVPLVHCIDQHSFTEVAHFINSGFVNLNNEDYNEVMCNFWDYGVGWNPRKPKYNAWTLENRKSDYVEAVLLSQKLVWNNRTLKPIDMGETKGKTSIVYTVDNAWLASFIGMNEIKKQEKLGDGVITSTFYVSIDPDSIDEDSLVNSVKTIRKPLRVPNGLTEIDDDMIESITEDFNKVLELGIKLKSIPKSLSSFKGSILKLVNGKYMIDGVDWNIKRNLAINFNVYDHPIPIPGSKSFELDVYQHSFRYTGDGIHSKVNEYLPKFVSSLDIRVINRFIIYTSSFSSKVKLYHIGRTGKGTSYGVNPADTQVNLMLSYLCCLYPGAIRREGTYFRVTSGPLFWTVVDSIKAYSRGKTLELFGQPQTNEWSITPGHEEKRELRPLQVGAIDSLIHDKNQKIQTIWIKMGLGKTAIITNYISQLIKEKKMPPYCLYIFPHEGHNSIINEFNMLGLKHVHLDQNGGSKKLIPGVVNFVYMHHLIKMDIDDLRKNSPNALIVIDEFHGVFSETAKKTMVALEIAKLSFKCITMTGTIFKNKNIRELIEWLSLCVKFEVTEANFWIAISSIISGREDLGIVVERESINAKVPDEMMKAYLKVVPPKMGGTATKIDFMEALKVSRVVVNKNMVEYALAYLPTGVRSYIIADNIRVQEEMGKLIESYPPFKCPHTGVMRKAKVHLIGKGNSVNFLPNTPNLPDIVITTSHYSQGYNLTACTLMIRGVSFSNQATREQLEYRMIRFGQTAKVVKIVIFHALLLSYVHNRYESERGMSKSIDLLADLTGEKVSKALFRK